MNRLITKKPVDDKNLKFMPMGSKPGISKMVTPVVAKKPKKTKTNPFAKKAAMALASKG